VICFALPVSAGQATGGTAQGELDVLCYNVAGLPIPSAFHRENRSPWEDCKRISAYFAKSGYDFIAVQEDFNCHRQLTSALKNTYPYQTVHQGAVPVGDGLGLFSKTPIYNQRNVPWALSAGIFAGANDQLTPKGYLHALAALDAPGVYVHIYVLHADASGDPASKAARADNYRQLAADIARYPEEPMLVMGDFNGIYTNVARFMNETGLRDSWKDLTDAGFYAGNDPGVGWCQSSGDSIDRILVRDGKGLRFTILESKNLNLQTAPGGVTVAEQLLTGGRSLSDHAAKYAKLAWHYDGNPQGVWGETGFPLTPPQWDLSLPGKQIKTFFVKLGLLWKGIDALTKERGSP
jgi:endonuclease/exonuclease/phosphatase family metal-dependent hydrolase